MLNTHALLPDSIHIMGTDAYGRDVFNRVLNKQGTPLDLELLFIIVLRKYV
jgi:ABC-type dipeptide/oligopeptide/nickel transport system permease subunit